MAQAAQRRHEEPHRSAMAGPVAAGGAIADMQRAIEERMMGTMVQAGSPALFAAEAPAFGHRLSRIAGPVLLAAAYAAVALWWF